MRMKTEGGLYLAHLDPRQGLCQASVLQGCWQLAENEMEELNSSFGT